MVIYQKNKKTLVIPAGIGNIPNSGYTQQDLDEAYNEGYDEGYSEGYLSGETSCSGSTLTPLTIELNDTCLQFRWDTNETKTLWIRKSGVEGDGEWEEWTSDNIEYFIVCSYPDALRKVQLKGNNLDYSGLRIICVGGDNTQTGAYAYGNIMSLVYGDDLANADYSASTNFNFYGLFGRPDNVLVDASALLLPQLNVPSSGYAHMFYGCTSLTGAPELPATTVGRHSYDGMFYGCWGLTAAPEISATTIDKYAFSVMFRDCKNLVTAPSTLPATTLANGCYANMFNGCDNLTTGPELPAPTLTNYCYTSMFNECYKLNYLKCLATNVSATNCLQNWLYGVQNERGTFVKDANMNIQIWPSNWTVVDAE